MTPSPVIPSTAAPIKTPTTQTNPLTTNAHMRPPTAIQYNSTSGFQPAAQMKKMRMEAPDNFSGAKQGGGPISQALSSTVFAESLQKQQPSASKPARWDREPAPSTSGIPLPTKKKQISDRKAVPENILHIGGGKWEMLAKKAGFLKPDGTDDATAYHRRSRVNTAKNAGFLKPDGTGDAAAYYRRNKVNTAKNAGFLKPDGTGDVTAYHRSAVKNTAKNAGFLKPDGTGDVTAYHRSAVEKLAKSAGLLKPDGTGDVKAYHRSAVKNTAKNAGFLKPDGTGDVTAYRRFRVEKSLNLV